MVTILEAEPGAGCPILSPPLRKGGRQRLTRVLSTQLHENGDSLLAHSGNELPLSAADLHQSVMALGPFWESSQIFTRNPVTLFGRIAFILVAPMPAPIES